MSTSPASAEAQPVLRLQPLDAALRARGVHLHYTSWLRLVRKKGLPALKIGGRFYVDVAALDRWLAAQAVAAVTAPSSTTSSSTAPRAMPSTMARAALNRRRHQRGRRASGGR